jgi:hypothetical protein
MMVNFQVEQYPFLEELLFSISDDAFDFLEKFSVMIICILALLATISFLIFLSFVCIGSVKVVIKRNLNKLMWNGVIDAYTQSYLLTTY